MSRDCLAEDREREQEYVARSALCLAVKAWQTWAPRAMAEKDAEIEALRTALRRVQADLEAARIRLGELPRHRTRLKVAGPMKAMSGSQT